MVSNHNIITEKLLTHRSKQRHESAENDFIKYKKANTGKARTPAKVGSFCRKHSFNYYFSRNEARWVT